MANVTYVTPATHGDMEEWLSTGRT